MPVLSALTLILTIFVICSGAESMKEWGTKWSALSEEEKMKYQLKAQAANSQLVEVDQTDRQRKACIKACMQAIYKQVNIQ